MPIQNFTEIGGVSVKIARNVNNIGIPFAVCAAIFRRVQQKFKIKCTLIILRYFATSIAISFTNSYVYCLNVHQCNGVQSVISYYFLPYYQ